MLYYLIICRSLTYAQRTAAALERAGAASLISVSTALLFPVALLTALWPRNTVRQMEVFRPTVRSCLTTALLAAWSILSFTGVVTFIYSNF